MLPPSVDHCRNGSEELAVSMFWQYVACLGTLPAWMALALYVSERASKGVL